MGNICYMPIEIQGNKTTLRGTVYIVNSVYTGKKNIAEKLGRMMLNDYKSEWSNEYFFEKDIAIEKQL